MINKLFAFFFIAYLLSSCVEDIENYALGNVDNMIPDGKELMFPAIPEVLLEKNIDDGYLVIRPLDGLFDEE